MLKKLLYLLVLFAVLLAGCAGPTSTTDEPPEGEGPVAALPEYCGDPSLLADELFLYTWVEYIDPELKDRFESECGVKITETNYDSNETLLAQLQAGGGGYDIIVPSDYMVDIMVEEGMLEELDYSLIPNIGGMEAENVNQYFDPEQKYTVPYFWGTSGIAVDTAVVPEPDPSWSLVFDPAPEVCGKISMLDDQREALGAALMYLGYSINSTDPAQLEAAKNLLVEQAECVKAYDSQTNDDLIVSGETALGHIWTGDAILAGLPDLGGREGIVYVIPREGCTIWQDNMAIPVGAPNSYTAHIFINFLADAEVAAQNAEFVGYGTPSAAAKEFIDPEILADEGIYPPEDVAANLQWIEDVGDSLELYDRTWTEFKAAIGG